VARTDEQARSADDRDIANRHGGGDQLRGPHLAADRPRPWSREDLQQRLERLPPGHPSSPYHADGSRKPPPPSLRALELPPPDARERARPDQSDAPAPAVEPLTDAEHAEHIAQVRELLDEARGRGLATDQQFMADERRGIWSKDRRDVHDALVDALYSRAEDVPDDRMAIMAGGLGGAGKSTVLDSQAGIERSCYLTINPDVIKEEMAVRGLIPQVDGLSPMEASDLVHEESSHIAKLLAGRAMADGKNVIWDITMASKSTTEQRQDDLAEAGYVTIGIFVDIPVEESILRADYRHRAGHEDHRNDSGYGGRYVPPEVMRSQADPEWGCVNRRTFEQIKYRFIGWAIYDNSVRGREPLLVASSEDPESAEQRRDT
jgi:predicted ABC-type ATPase